MWSFKRRMFSNKGRINHLINTMKCCYLLLLLLLSISSMLFPLTSSYNVQEKLPWIQFYTKYTLLSDSSPEEMWRRVLRNWKWRVSLAWCKHQRQFGRIRKFIYKPEPQASLLILKIISNSPKLSQVLSGYFLHQNRNKYLHVPWNLLNWKSISYSVHFHVSDMLNNYRLSKIK